MSTVSRPRKRVGISQSNYIPWRGYFDFIQSCDLFLIFDDVQYTNRDWRNRNRIKTPQGTQWLTVPVLHSRTDGTLIINATINYSTDWISEHENRILHSLGKAPFFEDHFDGFRKILNLKFETISQLNVALIEWINDLLEIRTPMHQSAVYEADGRKGDRIIDLLLKTEATEYISGPSAQSYLKIEDFQQKQIELFFKTYDYAEYSQRHPPYDPAVTILDLLCNVGSKRAKELIISQTADICASRKVELIGSS